jgi:hypothetical protein
MTRMHSSEVQHVSHLAELDQTLTRGLKSHDASSDSAADSSHLKGRSRESDSRA